MRTEIDKLLASDSLESVTFTRKQLIALIAQVRAEALGSPAAEKAAALSEATRLVCLEAAQKLRTYVGIYTGDKQARRLVDELTNIASADSPAAADAGGLSDMSEQQVADRLAENDPLTNASRIRLLNGDPVTINLGELTRIVNTVARPAAVMAAVQEETQHQRNKRVIVDALKKGVSGILCGK